MSDVGTKGKRDGNEEEWREMEGIESWVEGGKEDVVGTRWEGRRNGSIQNGMEQYWLFEHLMERPLLRLITHFAQPEMGRVDVDRGKGMV